MNMPLIEWNDFLSVKIEKFDSQHKKLISLLNDLYEAMKSGKGSGVIEKVLADLIDYTDYHFTSEEEAFEKYNYAYTEEHKKEHLELMNTAFDLQDKYKKGKALVTVKTLQFLNDWVKNHIKKSDKKYSEFFKDKL